MIVKYITTHNSHTEEYLFPLGQGPLDDVTRSNIAAAEELLKELKPKARYMHGHTYSTIYCIKQCCTRDPLRVKVLENYCALATRQKIHVERAMQSFGEILEGDPEYLPAVLGMATGFMIEKNQATFL